MLSLLFEHRAVDGHQLPEGSVPGQGTAWVCSNGTFWSVAGRYLRHRSVNGTSAPGRAAEDDNINPGPVASG